MKNYKKYIATLLAVGIVFGTVGCGSSADSSSSKKDDDSFEATENVEVADAEAIEAIPDGVDGTILYLGVQDLNPTRGNPEKSTELTLFESKGGSIQYSQTSQFERFDKLADAIMSNKDVPDIVNYEWLSFPAQVVKDMYQPIDELVDFDQPLWSGVKSTADQFVLGGKHYVAPLTFVASSMLCYDTDVIEAEGLDDPYEMYLEGTWDWNAFEDIMSEYVSGAEAGTDRYGINGFFRQHFIQQTGKNMVNYNQEAGEFESNLKDPDIEKGENALYEMMKSNLIYTDWVGSARDAFKKGCLFYAMGDWAYTGTNTPKDGENWAIVPHPQYPDNPQKITTSDMKAFMWVRGSTKPEAVKCWFECYRSAYSDPQYLETNKQKFMENNPNWTDEMYQVKMDVQSDEYHMIFDYAFGVSSMLGDPNSFDGNICLTDALYNYSSQIVEDSQMTWAQVREKYSATVDSEIKTLNESIKKFNSDNA